MEQLTPTQPEPTSWLEYLDLPAEEQARLRTARPELVERLLAEHKAARLEPGEPLGERLGVGFGHFTVTGRRS